MRKACCRTPTSPDTIDAVERLEDLGSVRKLMDLLRAAPRAMAAAE